ncbi:hypothetical protein TCT1_07740 [Xenorhabdus sp. TCT-1]|uniref:Uncharacterized protein n=1 Tax=Xenorhabdus taiwanensis TaxID=3085177 RepID=A0ABM8JT31_9GAMM|nr:hypothetical protein TCT1_07740 [Xenorhabdus sp. TCT-1]
MFFGESNYTKSSCCLIIPHKTSTRPSNAKIFFDSMNFEELTDSKIYTLRMFPKWQDFRLVKYKGAGHEHTFLASLE